jgi:TRAP-type C4-dicarboxylate transport system permease small subunit
LLKVETGILVSLLLSMIIMAVVQIVMRNLFSSGIIWADSFVRITVLWLTLVGAMVASRNGKHIAIDGLLQTLNEDLQLWVRRFTDTFAAIVCLVVMYFSFVFVRLEYEDGGLAFENIPVWLCESIIPFAFLVIGLRYLISAIFNIRQAE